MSTIKNIPQFWWLKHYIMDNGYDVGHPLFSFGHIIWLAVIILVCILVAMRYKKAPKNKPDLFRKICAMIVFALFTLLLLIPIYYIDITFDKNYMLLTNPSDFPLTKLFWDISTPLFGNSGYIALLICLELILFHIIYFVGKAIQRKNLKA